MTKEATSLKIEKPIMERIKLQALKENRSIGNFIETILIKYFEEIDKQRTKNPGE